MSAFLSLLKKDLVLELRTKETISVMLFLSLLMVVVLSSGITNAFIPEGIIRKLFPTFTWFIFIVTGAVALGRAHEYEQTHDALIGVILTGTSPASIFLSKVTASVLAILVGQCATVLGLGLLLDVALAAHALELLVLSFFVIVGYAAIGTLIAAMTATSKLRGVLLPLVLLPLLFPLFFSATELTYQILHEGALDVSSAWVSLLLGLDLVYLVLGASLYEQVIKPQ